MKAHPEVNQAPQAPQAPQNLTPQPFKRRRRGCDNCGQRFWIEERRKQHQRFCSDRCRGEWNHYGSGFAPMKRKLLQMMDERLKPGQVQRIFRAYVANRDFKRDLVQAGFIHRSQIDAHIRRRKEKHPDLAPRALRDRIEALESELRIMRSRVEIDALRAELAAAPPKAFAVKIQGADHPSDDGRDLDQYGVELRVS